LLLVIVLVVVSAYLRLHESGIGCPDWPSCYGVIGSPTAEADNNLAQSAYQRIVAESDAPLAWAAPLHRLVASLLGLAILFLTGLSIKQRKHRSVCGALLFLTVFLAWIGIRSGELHNPAIVMGNLMGGFLMLGLLGWLVFRLDPGSANFTQTRIKHIRPHVVAAIFILSIQILLGGLTSANFAATSCQSLPDCHGTWFPDATIYSAFKLNELREVTSQGLAVGGPERIAIHLAHRWGAVLTFLAVLIAAITGFTGTDRTRKIAYVISGLLVAEILIGITSVMGGIPIAVAVAHNWVAGLLLLALLKLLAISQVRWIPD
jgi:cytochrome c oxidase assembly protein subunit 15